ncbi:MAG: site-2 protease family protein [Planctomycetes bacterium]|nr:site-2 protease family protein [Planctomycetota bacterium]
MDWQLMFLMFVTLLISLTFHEAAHAWFAMVLGDRTAYRAGQVTLNPLPHMQREPFGMVLLPVISLYVSHGQSAFGFAHAPIDPFWAERNPGRAALMSFAGPLANFALVAIAWVVLWQIGNPDSDAQRTIVKIAKAFLFLNLLLGCFNLLPVPPLDGAGITRGLIPATGRSFDAFLQVPYLPFLAILALSYWLSPLVDDLYWTLLRMAGALW